MFLPIEPKLLGEKNGWIDQALESSTLQVQSDPVKPFFKTP